MKKAMLAIVGLCAATLFGADASGNTSCTWTGTGAFDGAYHNAYTEAFGVKAGYDLDRNTNSLYIGTAAGYDADYNFGCIGIGHWALKGCAGNSSCIALGSKSHLNDCKNCYTFGSNQFLYNCTNVFCIGVNNNIGDASNSFYLFDKLSYVAPAESSPNAVSLSYKGETLCEGYSTTGSSAGTSTYQSQFGFISRGGGMTVEYEYDGILQFDGDNTWSNALPQHDGRLLTENDSLHFDFSGEYDNSSFGIGASWGAELEEGEVKFYKNNKVLSLRSPDSIYIASDDTVDGNVSINSKYAQFDTDEVYSRGVVRVNAQTGYYLLHNGSRNCQLLTHQSNQSTNEFEIATINQNGSASPNGTKLKLTTETLDLNADKVTYKGNKKAAILVYEGSSINVYVDGVKVGKVVFEPL